MQDFQHNGAPQGGEIPGEGGGPDASADADSAPDASTDADADADIDPIRCLLDDLERGADWPTAMLRAMSVWRAPSETIDGLERNYFICGEAFDWLLMAERLCEAAAHLIPADERETLLFTGRFPERFDADRFKRLLGASKHSGYLNYFYGVVVEEALQLAVENEVRKRRLSNGNRYQDDFSDEAFIRIYRMPRAELLDAFCEDMGYAPSLDALTLTQCKEFTYWLFKRRMRVSDKAKVASDTRKGLAQMRALADALPQCARAGYAPELP